MGVGGADVVGNAMLLTVQAKELASRLVCTLTCLFVPRRANERRFVPLHLGTLWARPWSRHELRIQCPLGPEDNMVPLAAQAPGAHHPGKTVMCSRAR